MWSRGLGGMTGANAWQEDLFLMPEAACVCTGICHTPTQCEVCTNDGWHSDHSLSVVAISLALRCCSVIIGNISLYMKRENNLLSAKSFVGPLTKLWINEPVGFESVVLSEARYSCV